MAARQRLRDMKAKTPDSRPVSEIVGELRKNLPTSDYREQSLRIHGCVHSARANSSPRTGIF